MESIADYFKRVTRLDPIPKQIELLESLVNPETLKILVSCGRGFSKSLCSALVALHYADVLKKRVLIISHQSEIYRKFDNFFKDNKDLYDRLRTKGESMYMPLDGFEFVDGGSVIIRLDTSRQVRGNRSDVLILDEAQSIKKGLITKDALPCLGGSDIAKFIMIGTPSENGFFLEALNRKKQDFVIKQWGSDVCPWNSSILPVWKKEMSPLEWRTEVLAKPPRQSDLQFFLNKHIEKCLRDFVVRENPPHSSLEIGVDWGTTRSPVVCVVTEKIHSRRKVLEIRVWKKKANVFYELGQFIQYWKPDIIKADSKPSEFKFKVEPYCPKYKVHYIDATFHKETMLAQLRQKVMMHSLEIARNQVELVKQLQKYKKHMQYGDDIVDALALSIYEPSQPFSSKPQGKVIFPQ